MLYYVAGGAIRDLLFGRNPRDIDYVFRGTEEQFIQANPAARKPQNSPNSIYFLDGQEYCPLPSVDRIEEALKEDIFKRDFTINALLLSQDGILHAHPLSLSDLKSRIIRPTSADSIKNDPIRAYRAARMVAKGAPKFSLHHETVEQMQKLALDDLISIAAEQVGKEVLKASCGSNPGDFLRSLHKGSCLRYWFGELESAHDIPAGPAQYHTSSLLEHIALTMDQIAQLSEHIKLPDRERAVAVWMGLCHDLGKSITPRELLPHHFHHEKTGMAIAEALGTRLRLPRLFIKAGIIACREHMKGGRYNTLRAGTRVDLLDTLHKNHLFLPFSVLVAADSGNNSIIDTMQKDLDLMLKVRLPTEWRGLGDESGKKLREMRCLELSKNKYI